TAPLLRHDREGAPHRDRERLLYRPDQVLVIGLRTIRGVALDQEEPLAVPLEADHRLGPDRAPIETERVRPDTRGQRVQVEEVLAQPRDLEEDAARGLVDVEGEESILPLQARRPRGDRGER